MEQIIELIKNTISECETNGKMFHLPSIDREDVKITETDIEPFGAVLCGSEYHIVLDSGAWIHIRYESKDKCRSFQINPDRSIVTVTCSDSALDFSVAWDERY